MAHMRSAKVGLATRTVANTAAALRTVPAGRNQRTFLCVHYYRARIPDGTDMQDFDALVRCAATADVLRTGLHAQVSRVRRNQASACFCTAFATQRVRSKVESLRALHQYTNVQRRSALHAAPATLVARPARVESLHSSSHCGRCVVHERRNQFASTYAALRLRLGLRRSSCCACLHATAMEDARKQSQHLGQRLYRCAAAVEVEARGSAVP